MNTKQLTAAALMAALISVLAPLSIPLAGQVPVSLATLAVMLSGALIGSKAGTLSALIYLLLGFIGIPVFAGWTSGAGILFGMTGGYLFGYLPLAFVTGLFYEKKESPLSLFLGMLAGTVILYVLGTLWFMKYTGTALVASLSACVIPFLPGDLLKMILVVILAPRIHPAAMKLMK
ncbi:MAG: biotin transporter BioY [Solobacterium sp.]|nr:biotin transporter BioY [Solobacterium sp.]